MDLASLESMFKEIWEHDSSLKAKGKAYLSPFQKWTFRLMFIFFGLAVLIALSTKIHLYDWQKPFALFLSLLAQVTGVLHQFSFVCEGVKIFKAPARHFLEPVTESSAKDYKLAESFSRFSETQLFYAKERLSLESSHMKARVGMIVGAVEKLGIVPVLIAWLFASYKYFADGKVTFEQVDWLVYGLLALYLTMLPILFFVHKLERYQLLVITALEIKANKSSQQDAQKMHASA
ncbi:hypothetical protein [Marinobacterium stanieri]|uniref:hypothetical protein n=1 Tax=Marinobacterium stanieri TaxID=49186 RepID=UPI003A91BBAD